MCSAFLLHFSLLVVLDTVIVFCFASRIERQDTTRQNTGG